MAFRIVAVNHGYPNAQPEREVVTAAGGEFWEADGLPDAEAWRACEEADGILVRWVKVTAPLIAELKRCKIIVRYGVGTDNVDAAAATEAGIIVGHVPDYCLDEVSSHALALWLACVRNIEINSTKLRDGGWDVNPSHKIWRVRNRVFGLVGLGNIGSAVARKLRGWDLKVIATDPYVEPGQAEALGVELVDLATLCRTSDYISLHVPLLPETRHLMGAPEFALMKPGVILINTARGPIVDTEALATALETQVAGAGLDVFEREPLPLDSPLRGHPRVVLSDHVAWYSEESELELRQTAAREAVRVCQGGLPRSLANPEVLTRLGRWQEWPINNTVRWQLKRLAALEKGGGAH
jgi:D-3-phosphoglycerate dehydrogenase